MSTRYISAFFLFFLIFLNSLPTFSQQVNWAISDGGHLGDSAWDVNIIEDGVVFLTTAGLERRNALGELIWRFDFFDLDDFRYSRYGPALGAITTDSDGNIYAQLTFPASESGTTTIANIDIPHGDSLIKINASGQLLWAKKIEGAKSTRLEYHNGIIYAIGMFNKTINIGDTFIFEKPENTECTYFDPYYEDDIFIAQFNTIGQVVDAIQYGGQGDNELKAVSSDSDGNIYLAINYGAHSCIVDETQLHKINSNLSMVWSKTISKQYEEGNGEAILLPSDIHIGENGKLYIWTYAFDTVVSDNFRFINTEWAFAAGLLEYSPQGNFLNYRAFDGFPFYGQRGYFADYKGHLLLATSFTGTKEFDNGSLTTTNPGTEPVLIKVDLNNLNMDYLIHLSGTPQQYHTNVEDWSGPIKIDQNHLYYSGSFSSGELNVSNEITLVNNSGNNDKDYFLIKYDLANLDFTPIDEDADQDSVPNRLDICPNTTLGEEVDENGCSLSQKDSDNDGVNDYIDLCANSSTGAQVDENGCAQDQLDDDQDGVPNDLDSCPDTPINVTVNSEGCEFLFLDALAFEVKSIGESCLNTNNGRITIQANDSRSYKAVLNASKDLGFTSSASFGDLTPGSYELCISATDVDSDVLCYNLTIDAVENLGLSAKADLKSNLLNVELSGGKSYVIEFNGETILTQENSIKLPLKTGKNSLTVSTELDCQGKTSYEFNVSESIVVYPNPFSSEFEVYESTIRQDITIITVYDLGGRTIIKRTFGASEPIVLSDFSSHPNGMYILEYKEGEKIDYQKIIKNE